MAVIAYGQNSRVTFDIDAEVLMEDYDFMEALIAKVQQEKIKKSAEKAIETSPKSIEIGNFKRILSGFEKELK